MGEAPRVLVIDDDPDLRDLVRGVLERDGLRVEEAGSGGPGLGALFARPPDLVVLDLEMPGVDGWETLTTLRQVSSVGVLILSAHGMAADRVRGLMAGADDFLPKPFQPAELAARVHALLRRTTGQAGDGRAEVVDTGHLRLDMVARRATRDGEPLDLTGREFQLLQALMSRPGMARSFRALADEVWGQLDPADVHGNVTVLVARLRAKLGPDPRTGASPIENVRGYGFRLAVPGPGAGA